MESSFITVVESSNRNQLIVVLATLAVWFLSIFPLKYIVVGVDVDGDVVVVSVAVGDGLGTEQNITSCFLS